jgi:hypothetical protein
MRRLHSSIWAALAGIFNQTRGENVMKKIILVAALALVAACGSSKGDDSAGVGSDDTSVSADTVSPSDTSNDDSTADPTEDTITVENFGDMPPKCIELLGAFLKKIEPTVSKVDWDKATLADFEAFGTQFEADSNSFDAETEAAGCNKYNLEGSDATQFEQMAALAAAEAPGTLGFITFLSSVATGASATAESIPADCAGIIAAIEPYLDGGGKMNDLTMVEVTRFGQLMTGISSTCTSEEAATFFAREDVNAFISG